MHTEKPKKQNIFNYITTVLAVAGFILAFITWQNEISKRKIDTSLKYIDLLTENNFFRQLSAVAEFTLCFEKRQGVRLSYFTREEFESKKNDDKILDAARLWWSIVEDVKPDDCKKIASGRNLLRENNDIQENLNTVYSTTSRLGSCITHNLCDPDIVDAMYDALDSMSPQAFNNYIRLSSQVSREWNSSDSYYVYFTDHLYEMNKEYILKKREQMWNREIKLPEGLSK